MVLHLKLRPPKLLPIRRLSSSSSSNLPPPPPPPPEAADPPAATAADAAAESTTPYTSYFSDIKNRLKTSSPPRKIPESPQPPPPFPGSTHSSPASLADIRKQLAGFRLNTPNPSPHPSAPSPPTLSFHDIYRNSYLKDSAAGPTAANPSRDHPSFDSIRHSLRSFKPAARADTTAQIFGRAGVGVGTEHLPDSIFGRELSNKDGKADGSARTEFLKTYSYEELGQKLRALRPEAAKNGGGDWFSLAELHERLAKLREFEDKETESKMGGMGGAFMFRELRDSLDKLKDADDNKKSSAQRLSILTNLGGLATPAFMLKPPQDQLLEKYFHPDHMSSAEKMKLELQRVRDEFKMSESDCGSAPVQVAQLTTKIKHLSPLLHKKDKHSRKGLQEMVQRRKKLLKYLRRTDWDSYYLVLSKLGLRDVPEYKTPDYKNKNLIQTKKSKGKRKKKSTGKRREHPVAA